MRYPDYTTLSDPWTQPVGFFRALGSQVQGGQAVNLAILNAVHQSDVDVQAFVSITGLNHTAGLLARYQGAGNTNFYLGKLSRTNTGFTAAIFKNVAGVVTLLTTANITSTTGKANLRFLVTGTSLNLFVNNILVVNAFDTSLATGSVGIRADAYARLDDFRASAVTTDVPFSDNFNQPDNSGLSIQWTRRAGDFKVAGNTAVAASPTALSLATLVGVQQANVNVKADVTLTTSGDEVGLLASYAGPGDAELLPGPRAQDDRRVQSQHRQERRRRRNDVDNPLDVAALTGTISFRIQGTSLLLFMNNVQQLSATDSSLTAGSVGIRSVGTGAIDNFAVTKTAFLPFNDAFPSASGPNLSGNWTTRAGGYTTAAASAIDTAKGTAALNLATLGRFDMSDVAVQADISVSNTAGEFASLAARYSGAGDLNMYLATVAWDGTQFVASISKRLNGVTTQLASTAIGSGAGTLRFTVVGSQLTLSFGGVDLLSTWDFALQSGSVGIRSSLGSTFDNFSANQAT